jgi:hypothetical protein
VRLLRILARGEQQNILKSCGAKGDLTQPGQGTIIREQSDRLVLEQGVGRLALGEEDEFADGAISP